MSRNNGGHGGDLLFLLSMASLVACSAGDSEAGYPVTNTGWPDAPTDNDGADEDEEEQDDDEDRDGGSTSGGGPTGPDDTPWPDSESGQPPSMPPGSTTTGGDPTEGPPGTSGQMPPDYGSEGGDYGSSGGQPMPGVDFNAICQAYGQRYTQCYGYGDPSTGMEAASYCIMEAMSYGSAGPGCGQAFEELYACILNSPCGQLNCDAQAAALYEGPCGG